MRIRMGIAAAMAVILTMVGIYYFLWKTTVERIDFKSFAESKVGDFLKAKVSISGIKIGFINQVALTGLNINPGTSRSGPYEVHIDQIVFQYDLFKILTHNFKTPSSITLQSPEIALPGELFPYDIFKQMNLGKGQGLVSNLKLKDGYVRYPIPALDSDLELQEISGVFEPSGPGIFSVNFQAHLRGLLEGNVRVEGIVNALEHTHQLTLHFSEVNFGQKVNLPFHGLTGDVRWENDSFYFTELHAVAHGWKVKMDGMLEHFASNPIFKLNAVAGKGKPLFAMSVETNLGANSIKANFEDLKGFKVPITGKIFHQGLRYEFSDLQINSLYRGKGWLDFESGDYHFDVQNEQQKISIHSNLKGLDFKIQAGFEHLKIYGLDVVASTHIHLIPYEESLDEKLWRFQGTFHTDYFILEYSPLEDFRGSFEITPYGIKNFLSSWGKVFNLNGNVSFRDKKKPHGNFTLKVEGFDLAKTKDFFNRPLPKQLGGYLEGKLKCEGPLDKMEFVGNLTAKSGFLGKVEYDLAIIQFRGYLPYFQLYESRVMRGRTSLSLEGALNFSLPNIFHGIEIKTPDKFAVWKGWELSTHQDNGSVEINKDLMPTLAIQSGGHDASLNQGNPQQEEDKYLAVGPKLKF